MLTANEALKLGTKDIDLDRMLKIADSKVKEAVANKSDRCCILFSKHTYSDLDIRNFKNKVSGLGYLVLASDNVVSANYSIELKW